MYVVRWFWKTSRLGKSSSQRPCSSIPSNKWARDEPSKLELEKLWMRLPQALKIFIGSITRYPAFKWLVSGSIMIASQSSRICSGRVAPTSHRRIRRAISAACWPRLRIFFRIRSYVWFKSLGSVCKAARISCSVRLSSMASIWQCTQWNLDSYWL